MSHYIFENENVYEVREALGKALDDARKEKSLNQVQLAELFGCPQPRISSMLSRPESVTTETWMTYLDKLGVEVTIQVG